MSLSLTHEIFDTSKTWSLESAISAFSFRYRLIASHLYPLPLGGGKGEGDATCAKTKCPKNFVTFAQETFFSSYWQA